jgi:putative flippase GtrA
MSLLFHRIFEKVLCIFHRFSFWEAVRFGLSGAGVMVIHLVLYYSLLLCFDYKTSNLIALTVAKVSAFLLNKFWVFKSSAKGKSALWEIFRYILVRVICTGCLDFFGLIFLVDVCGFNEKIVKPIILIFVTILNFLLGKFFVFVNNAKSQSIT